MVERLKVNQIYLAPTALRVLLKYDDHHVTKYDRSTLKTLGCGTFLPVIHVNFASEMSLSGAHMCASFHNHG